jgi:hypothetical protein
MGSTIAAWGHFLSLSFEAEHQLVPIHKWPICPLSALHEKFNPRNIDHMPAVKFFVRLDLDQICLFLNGHQMGMTWMASNFDTASQF